MDGNETKQPPQDIFEVARPVPRNCPIGSEKTERSDPSRCKGLRLELDRRSCTLRFSEGG